MPTSSAVFDIQMSDMKARVRDTQVIQSCLCSQNGLHSDEGCFAMAV